MACMIGEVTGVTQLESIVYVVFARSCIIKTYTADELSPLANVIRVEDMRNPSDIVACRRDRQLYVADWDYCIWRVSVDDHSHVKWLSSTDSATDTFHVSKLSLTHHLLMITPPRSLHQYNRTDGKQMSVIQLPNYVREVYHAVVTERGTFLVGHRGTSQDKDECAVRNSRIWWRKKAIHISKYSVFLYLQ